MKRQCGFGAIMAIVVLVILASLAAAIVKFGSAQQATSTQDILSARAWQAAKAGNEWGLFQALRGSFAVANASGATGANTINTTNNFLVAGVVAGMAVAGTGVGAGATVTIVTAAQITVSVLNANAVVGPLTFSPAGCAGSPQTLDLHDETGFWVTVTCNSTLYDEGETCTPGCASTQIRVFQIDAVACNSAGGCPAAAAIAKTPYYIERMREVISTN